MERYNKLALGLTGIVARSASIADPAISIVLPTFNRAKLLLQAVESVLALDEEAFELIIVDDGSTDTTVEDLHRISDPRVGIVRLPGKSGANAARNAGIAHSRAPYIAFVDSDDTYLPGRLKLPLKVLERQKDVGIVLSAFTTEKASKTTVYSMPERIYTGRDLLRLVARTVIQPTTSGLTIRRDVLEAVGGFDPTLMRMQDSDLVMRVAQRTMAATIADPLWHKRWQSDGISSNRETYFPALLALIARHEIYQNEELEARDYLIARHLVALAKTMRFRQLQSEYNLACEQLAPPPPPLTRLIAKYRISRRNRRQLRNCLLSGRPVADIGEAPALSVAP